MILSEMLERMDYVELLQWKEYYDQKLKQHEPVHYYLAQIAASCLQPWTKRRIKIQDMLIKFEGTKRIKLSPKELAKRLKAYFGIKEK